MGEVINTLKEFGMTEYEAKIYVSLLSNQPSNGNNIAKLSGVPAPKVYGALQKMKEQGLVFTVSGGNNGKQVRYSPLPYKELLKTKKDTFMDQLEFLGDSLEEISSNSDVNWSELFVIEGYSASVEVVQTAISECESEIIISCWKREFDVLEELLFKAHERGIKIVTLIFDGEQVDVPWDNFTHYGEGLALGRHSGEFSIVIDNKKAILLQSLDESPHSVVSSHPVMVSTTRNYIRHDIYVNRIIKDFEGTITEHYGKNLENLINDF
ncbi:transcriptional regulator [Thalassobacillus devorans]|uniref:Transcriptional regulator n=1 Tax=Thalassobacillus devorans TaxID=279813 RepID=A0ABQ1NIX9_9BACI|nr:TrmB family transcriptional regulator [Thalassobacillus devorans]NIK27245.1 sugar-specific transcriptional regulator TrmB [Thalassobacillus devorans]GGC76136.1 transcriptional regulator [Thalassobacillus devorans]